MIYLNKVYIYIPENVKCIVKCIHDEFILIEYFVPIDENGIIQRNPLLDYCRWGDLVETYTTSENIIEVQEFIRMKRLKVIEKILS